MYVERFELTLERSREDEVADTQSRSDCLRERGRVGDELSPLELEQRRRRGALVADEAIGIILQYGQVVLARKLDEAVPPLGAERSPTRVLEGWDRVEERRLVSAGERLLERGRFQAVGGQGVRGDLDAVGGQDLQRAVVGRRFDEHPPRAKPLSEEHHALQRAVGDQHASGIDTVALADPLAQRLVAADRPVRQDGRAVTLDGRACTVRELLDGDALVRRVASGEGDRLHLAEFRAHWVKRGEPRNGAGRNA